MTSSYLPLDPTACEVRITGKHWQRRLSIADDGCWLMDGGNRTGYIQIKLQGRLVQGHRVALVAALGRDLLPGMTVGHLCHDRAFAAGLCTATEQAPCAHRRCVNPEHLVEQTMRDNVLAGGTPGALNAARATCRRGHSLVVGDPDADLIAWTAEHGGRGCRTCAMERYRARNAAVTAARKSLGLSAAEYLRLYGSSKKTADRLLARYGSNGGY